jgi:hypothetical protein
MERIGVKPLLIFNLLFVINGSDKDNLALVSGLDRSYEMTLLIQARDIFRSMSLKFKFLLRLMH